MSNEERGTAHDRYSTPMMLCAYRTGSALKTETFVERIGSAGSRHETMEIVPFNSIGSLAFGDSRKAARHKLLAAYREFEKLPGQQIDVLDGLGLHLYYGDDDQLEFVEAFDPADITFCGIRFLGRNVSLVVDDMRSLGLRSVPADSGIDVPDAGIALYAPEGVVEGVAAHRRGYYE